jgi:hypothetical protein
MGLSTKSNQMMAPLLQQKAEEEFVLQPTFDRITMWAVLVIGSSRVEMESIT